MKPSQNLHGAVEVAHPPASPQLSYTTSARSTFHPLNASLSCCQVVVQVYVHYHLWQKMQQRWFRRSCYG